MEYTNDSPGIKKWHTSAAAKKAYTYIPADSLLPSLRSTENTEDPIAHIKLFNPTGSWTWYLTEADRLTGEAFGLVVGHETELGYIDLGELSAVRGGMGLPIERDIHFKPTPISVLEAKHSR